MESLNLLKEKKINQYFVDVTFKVVIINKNYKCLI